MQELRISTVLAAALDVVPVDCSPSECASGLGEDLAARATAHGAERVVREQSGEGIRVLAEFARVGPSADALLAWVARLSAAFGGARLGGAKIALCSEEIEATTSEPTAVAVRSARALLAAMAPDQVLVTAPAAVLAAPCLTGSHQLVYRGQVSGRDGTNVSTVYELQSQPLGDKPAGRPADVAWAQRIVLGRVDEAANAVAASLEAWSGCMSGKARVVLVAGRGDAVVAAVAAEVALVLDAGNAAIFHGRWDARDPSKADAAIDEAVLAYQALTLGGGSVESHWLSNRATDRVRPGLGDGDRSIGVVASATRVLRGAAAEWPVVVILEGLPEGEPAALVALEHLRRGLAGCCVLVLVTQRRDEAVDESAPEIADVFTDVISVVEPRRGQAQWARVSGG
jgi:hypothetical protein